MDCQRQGALAPAEARRLLLQLAGGVGFAHARGRLERRRELFDRFRQATMNSGTKRLKPKLLLSTVRE